MWIEHYACWYARGNPLQNPRGEITLNYVQCSSSSFIHHKFLKWHSSFLSYVFFLPPISFIVLFMRGKTLANTNKLLTCFDQFITNMIAFHCELNILTCWYARGNPLQNPRGKINLNYVQRSSSSFIHHKILKWHISFLSYVFFLPPISFIVLFLIIWLRIN